MHTAVEKQASAQDTSEIRRNILLKDVVEEIKLSPEVRAESRLVLIDLASIRSASKRSGCSRCPPGSDRSRSCHRRRFRSPQAEPGMAPSFLGGGGAHVIIVLIGLVFDGLTSLTTANWVQRIGTTVSILSGLATGAIASWKKLSHVCSPSSMSSGK